MTRKELEQAKRDLMEIQQEREKVREGTKEGKKLIKRCCSIYSYGCILLRRR